MVATIFQKGRRFINAQQTSIMSAAAVIGALSVVSAVLGLVRSRFLVSYLGRSEIDAFLVGFRIPDFMFSLLVAGVLSATFIPVFTRVSKQSEFEAHNLVNALITQLSLIYFFFSLIVGIFAPQILRLMTGPGFLDAQVLLAANMTRMMLASTYLLLLSNFLSGILQSNRHFLLPALSPVLYNLGIIVGIVFLTPVFGSYGPAAGVVLGSLVHLLVQLPLAVKLGFNFSFHLGAKDLAVREVYRLMAPRGATLTTNYVEDFVGVYLVTSIGGSFVLIYTLASQLAAAPIRLFGVSIAQAALPFLSLKAKEEDWAGFVDLLARTLHQIAFFMFPAGALLLVLRIPLVRLAFGAKRLPWSDTVLLGRLVAIYALSIAVLAMTHVILRAFYALKETRLPFAIAFASMSVNIAIMILGTNVFHLGILAVALGPTLAAILEFLLLLVFILRRLKHFNARTFFYPQLKMVLATVLMGLSLYYPMKILDQLVFDTTRVVGLLMLTSVVSCVGLLTYWFFSWVLRVEQLSILASIQGKLRGWQGRLSQTTEVLNEEV